MGTPGSVVTHVERRPFLPPMVKARLILLSVVVGEVGLIAAEVLPERRGSELPEDWEEDLLRCSSARMSSKETFKWGWLIGTSSRFSTKREAIAVVVGIEVGGVVVWW
jgi:hypothetical protein